MLYCGQLWQVNIAWCRPYVQSPWTDAAARAAMGLTCPSLLPPSPARACTQSQAPSPVLPYCKVSTISCSAGAHSVLDPAMHDILVTRQQAMALVVTRAELLLSTFFRELLAERGAVLPPQLAAHVPHFVAGALRVTNPFSGDGVAEVCPVATNAWTHSLHRLNRDFPLSDAQHQLLASLQGASGAVQYVADHIFDTRLRQLTGESLRSIVRTHLTIACAVPESMVDALLDADGPLPPAAYELYSGAHNGLHSDSLGWSASQVRSWSACGHAGPRRLLNLLFPWFSCVCGCTVTATVSLCACGPLLHLCGGAL